MAPTSLVVFVLDSKPTQLLWVLSDHRITSAYYLGVKHRTGIGLLTHKCRLLRKILFRLPSYAF